MTVKLFTLNTHSLLNQDTPETRAALVDFLLTERPDIMALQEVNQPWDAPHIKEPQRGTSLEAPLCEGNFLCDLANQLTQAGWPIWWAWAGFKQSWGRFCEGIALASPHELCNFEVVQLSNERSEGTWRARKGIGANIVSLQDHRFYSLHFGWDNDDEDSFAEQFERAHMLKKQADIVWLMGDFNVDAHIAGEGYDLVQNLGWHDSFKNATEVHGDATAPVDIDGWQNKTDTSMARRIDYLFSSSPIRLKSHRVCLDGTEEINVSDHFGILVETNE